MGSAAYFDTFTPNISRIRDKPILLLPIFQENETNLPLLLPIFQEIDAKCLNKGLLCAAKYEQYLIFHIKKINNPIFQIKKQKSN